MMRQIEKHFKEERTAEELVLDKDTKNVVLLQDVLLQVAEESVETITSADPIDNDCQKPKTIE